MADELIIQAHKMGIQLTDRMSEQFQLYETLLLEWNTRMNLTAITDPIGIRDKHFLDSLSCVLPLQGQTGRVIDIGTGAGFPGLPIKIAQPQLEVTLLDALNKRVSFLSEVIQRLGLHGIEAVHGRAEECSRKSVHRERYDFAFARAVARLNVLCEYCLPYVKVGGLFISQKGADFEQEVAESSQALKKLGSVVEEILPVSIPDTDFQRALIIIRKTQPTPTIYPRHSAKIDKAPL